MREVTEKKYPPRNNPRRVCRVGGGGLIIPP